VTRTMPAKKKRVAYSEDALSHLERLTAWLADKADATTALSVMDELLDRIEVLSEMPLLGHPHRDPVLADRGYRALSLGNYGAVYLVTEDGPWIAGVFSTKTDYLRRL